MSANDRLPERNEVPQKERWRLDHLFESDAAWEAALSEMDAGLEKTAELRDALTGASGLYAAVSGCFALGEKFETLMIYALMTRDQDTADPRGQGLADRAGALAARFAAAFSFLTPAILALSEESVRAAMAEPRFADYRRYLEGVLRKRAHTLSPAEERLIAMYGEVQGGPRTIYGMATDADMRFGTIQDEQGHDVEVTHGRYRVLMENRNREVRKAAYTAMMSAHKAQENALSAMFSAHIKGANAEARARGYEGPLQAALFANEIPQSVFDSLIATVKSRAKDLSRYAAYRLETLGLTDLYHYDLYVPLNEGFDLALPYPEAYDLVVDALSPLGKEYGDVLRQAKDGGWIDVHETRGKRGGAYMMPSHRAHPFVLLNHQGTLDSAMTIAHEMGHALHTYRSVAAQPFPMTEYPIFLAEVASTVNEELMLSEMLRRNPGRDAQRALLTHRLEGVRTTVVRQTMFADFERRAHEVAWNGEALTAQGLCDLYEKTVAEYYLPPVTPDELIRYEWMRIPHMYMGFYVYQYATGHSAAVAIARRIMAEGEAYVKDYLKFLSLGGSMPPLEALKTAGIDMSSPAPVAACLDMFNETLDALIALE